jgi:ADP-heptose:LPS heptosyltransferase
MKVLVRLYANHKDRRGMGDSVQFIIVLKHLKKAYPNWQLYTETTSGKENCYNGFVNHTYNAHESPSNPKDFDKVINFFFPEPTAATSDLSIRFQVPSSKPTHAIFEDLKLEPDPKLFKYEIKIQEQIRRMVKQYMGTIPNKNGIVTIHHRAASSPYNKDIDERDLSKLCDSLIHNGFTPLILDWKGTKLPDQKRIFIPDQNNSIWMGKPYGDVATIAAIIEQSRLFIGVDSGPLHLAGATQTPSIGYWKYHHPVHYFDFSHVVHMVPHEHLKYIKSNNKAGTDDLFQRNYKHRWYSHGNRAGSLIDTAYEVLNISNDKHIQEQKQEQKIIFPFCPIQDRQWWTIKVQ